MVGFTIPDPTILATAVDMNAPATLSTPAAMTATSGLTTLVETTVAMALALSCNPFEKSNKSASTTTTSSIPVSSGMRPPGRHEAMGKRQEVFVHIFTAYGL